MFASRSNSSRCWADNMVARALGNSSERVRLATTLVFVGALVAPCMVEAQVIPDSTRRDSVVTPVVRLPATPDSAAQTPRRSPNLIPPISPRRAFLMSFLLPGYSQAKLDRATSGALFAGIEMASIAMWRRSASDVREVQRQIENAPGNFRIDPATEKVVPLDTVPSRFEEGLLRTRKLHVEDWLAAIAFNHLIAGADAFVAAQLWDVPVRMSVAPTTQGWMLMASIKW